jgi:hypothetical protein
MTGAMGVRCGGLCHAARKPDGGFCFIPAMAILGAWFAYKRSIIRLVDFRVWLACFEVVARRHAALRGCRPKYRHEEIHALIGGVGGEHVRHSVRRLESAGLLNWSDSCISVGHCPEFTDTSGFERMCMLVKNRKRKVPVPRRLLRLLAQSSRSVFIATSLGHLLRCLYYRKGTCRADGRCKASWVADVFGVDGRNVKRARKELRDLELLNQVGDTQRAMNRWGPLAVINLRWDTDDESPPREAVLASDSPPPMKDRNLSSRSDHQKPGQPDRTGFFKSPMGKPTFKHVMLDDLKDRRRLRCLFAESVMRGWCKATEAQELDFFAAAARAVRVGTRNPCGLFATLVRRQGWRFLSGEDEDRGRRMLRELHEGKAFGHEAGYAM